MKKLILIFLLATTTTVLSEFALTKENLENGKLVASTESSNHVGLYCVHRGLTTGTMMVLMERSRKSVLAAIPVTTTYSSSKPSREWLTVVWNEGATAVAIHDSSKLKSELLIYRRLAGGKFKQVELLNLGVRIAENMGIAVDEIKASGEVPVKWTGKKELQVNFRYTLTNGKRHSHKRKLKFDSDWKVETE